MSEFEGMEQGVHAGSGQPTGWVAPLLCMSDTGRELLRVTPGGEVWIAPDLTMREARELIENLALAYVKAGPCGEGA
jgi:hypothetical protein